MHFLIYVPEQTCHPDRLADLGLMGLVDGAFAATGTGPDGRMGTVFGWRPEHGPNRGRLAHHCDLKTQTWRPAAAMSDMPAGRYHVGTINGQEPIPEDLMRRYPFRGHKVELSQGNPTEWWLPAEADLPYDRKLQDDGSWRFVPQRRFDAFCEATAHWRNLIDECNINPTHMQEEIAQFVSEALSINYRLCPEIEDSLALFSSSRSGTIMPAFLSILQREWAVR